MNHYKVTTKIFKVSFILYCLIALLNFGCNSLVEVGSPSISTNEGNVYNTDANAIGVLNGIYASMSSKRLNDGSSLNSFMSLYVGLSSDEFTLYEGVQSEGLTAYYQNNLTNGTYPSVWLSTYGYIFVINSAIEGLNNSNGLTAAVKKQLLGEAKFLRAFSYFYLINLYGDVPLALTSDYKINTLLARSSVDNVYQQVIMDLKDASDLLNEQYVGNDGVTSSTERVVPTKWAAKALLAKVYLYTKDYNNAISAASDVINYNELFALTDLNDVFLMNSSEAIWQLQPVNLGWNTEDGRLFIIPEDTGPTDDHPVFLSASLMSNFEKGDQRRQNWVDSVIIDGTIYYFPYKYKNGSLDLPVTEYQMMLRLGEVYLIRAEAYANLGSINEALLDLNAIRKRAGLSDYIGDKNKDGVINGILHERRIELFSEWGNRWLDIKRTNIVDNVMNGETPIKGGVWNSYKQLYPINASELSLDPNLTQNSGY